MVVLDKTPAEYATVLAQVNISLGINLMMLNLKYAKKTQWQFLIKKSVKKLSEFSLSAFNSTCYNGCEMVTRKMNVPKKVQL